jgi:ferritin-like metal-binding protein YciE
MTHEQQKVTQYLHEAHTTERALGRILQSQIAIAPRGSFRQGLESHRRQTAEHAERIEQRLNELGDGGGLLSLPVGLLQDAVGQAVALGKTPFDLVRGTGREEKVLKNAKDACAAEALEIATYTAIETLAHDVGDEDTARLAASIRDDEEKMLVRLLGEIPRLTDAVVKSEVGNGSSYALAETGAADAVRTVGKSVKKTADKTAGKTNAKARRTARQARKLPGVAQAEGQIKGALAEEGDLAIAGYGQLTAVEIVEKLAHLSQIELAKIDSFERKHDSRTTILARVTSLRGDEPWPGYDELGVKEILAVLDKADDLRIQRVRSYERGHKSRSGVLEATERELAGAPSS